MSSTTSTSTTSTATSVSRGKATKHENEERKIKKNFFLWFIEIYFRWFPGKREVAWIRLDSKFFLTNFSITTKLKNFLKRTFYVPIFLPRWIETDCHQLSLKNHQRVLVQGDAKGWSKNDRKGKCFFSVCGKNLITVAAILIFLQFLIGWADSSKEVESNIFTLVNFLGLMTAWSETSELDFKSTRFKSMRFEIRKQSFRVSERLSDWVMDDSHLRKERRGGEREREGEADHRLSEKVR